MLAGGQGSLTEPTGVSQNRGTRGQAGRGSAGVKRSDQGWTGPPSRLGWASGPTAPPLAGRQQGRSLLPGPPRSLSVTPPSSRQQRGTQRPSQLSACASRPHRRERALLSKAPAASRGPPRGEAHPGARPTQAASIFILGSHVHRFRGLRQTRGTGRILEIPPATATPAGHPTHLSDEF